MGPLISAKQKARVEGYVDSGKSDAKLAYGADVPKGLERGHYVGPTIFDGVQSSMRIAREEIFGPVLSVLTFKEEGEALALANDCPCGLAASVVTRDVGRDARGAGVRGRQRLDQCLGRGQLHGALRRLQGERLRTRDGLCRDARVDPGEERLGQRAIAHGRLQPARRGA
jgi:hypothetical protein